MHNDAVWKQLSVKLREEPDLLEEHIVPQILFNSWKNGRAVIKKAEDKIIAYVSLWETNHSKWFELGTLWVDRRYRERRISSEIFFECLNIQSNGSGIFIITHNPKVIHLANRFGFCEATIETWSHLPWSVTCAPCDRIPENEKESCPFRAIKGKCSLYFTRRR